MSAESFHEQPISDKESVTDSPIDKDSSPELSDKNQKVQQILDLFRAKSIQLSKIGGSDDVFRSLPFGYSETIDGIIIALPSNLESFADNQLVISIMHLLEKIKNVQFEMSITPLDLDTFKIDRKTQQSIIGYISVLLNDEVQEYPSESASYGRGRKAALSDLADDNKLTGPWFKHLNIGLMDLFLHLTKKGVLHSDLYSRIRHLIALRRKQVKISSPCILMKSKAELERTLIKTRFLYENGGIFTNSEMQFLKEQYSEEIKGYEKFRQSLENPSEDLIKSFMKTYRAERDKLSKLESICEAIILERRPILFKSSKKKTDQNFNKLSLSAKIATLDADTILSVFNPSKLLEEGKISFNKRNEEGKVITLSNPPVGMSKEEYYTSCQFVIQTVVDGLNTVETTNPYWGQVVNDFVKAIDASIE